MIFEEIGEGIQKVTLPDGSIRYRYGNDSAELWLTIAEARRHNITVSTLPTKNKE
jgi:hypothetical protein